MAPQHTPHNLTTTALILMSVVLAGLTCEYHQNPEIDTDLSIPILNDDKQFLQDRIYWTCQTNLTGTHRCISVVHETTLPTSPAIQTNPVSQDIEGIGVIDTFHTENQVTNVYFRAETNIIRPGITRLFAVHCSNGTTNEFNAANITPTYKNLAPAFEFLTFHTNQIPLYFAAFFLLIILLWGVIIVKSIFTDQ